MPERHRELTAAMHDYARRARVELRYVPSYFIAMLNERGGYETAIDLIQRPKPSEGFIKLYQLGRLDLTVEALVLEDDWKSLFDEEILNIARTRLRAVGYPK